MNTKQLSIISGAVLLILGGAFLFAYKNSGPLPGGTACTMEALLCPDGSAVGRTGPNCEFSACPNQASFVGTLRQDSNGFNLLIQSPNAEIEQEVVYTMPLEIKVSNALADMVGKRVEVFGTFKEGALLLVDRLELLEGEAGDPTLGEVSVGDSELINGVFITLNGVVQDSRCPVDVVCIEAGGIVANVTLKSNTDQETRNFPSDEVPYAFDVYQISIVSVKPDRVSDSEPAPESYTVTFKVVEN